MAAPSTGVANTSEVPPRLSTIAAIAANIVIFMNFPKFGTREENLSQNKILF